MSAAPVWALEEAFRRGDVEAMMRLLHPGLADPDGWRTALDMLHDGYEAWNRRDSTPWRG